MVGRDHVYRSVKDSLEKCQTVVLRPKRRIHLEPALLTKVVLTKREIVRRGLAGHVHTVSLSLTYKLDRASR